ncbi:Inositol-trisphosphate 3-kinase B [Eumeta japonica]|uniref:Inositol-trisphosphate 3-kinase B n=1 Tax=Eumeta variegata TaxID=151549 RepID=A0A4C1Z9G2_EUMVA|nr:Inositol-trisphosphate 3-kinase B [Eumeta japonica]
MVASSAPLTIEDFMDVVFGAYIYNNKKQSERWKKLRTIVQWTPFFQTYKKQRYPWVQLAGHQGNFKAGLDQGTILKKLSPQEERCFQLSARCFVHVDIECVPPYSIWKDFAVNRNLVLAFNSGSTTVLDFGPGNDLDSNPDSTLDHNSSRGSASRLYSLFCFQFQ